MSVEGRELAACPMCSGPADVRPQGNNFTKSRRTEVGCRRCNLSLAVGAIRNDLEWTTAQAIAAWNRRATPPDQSLRAALGKLADEWEKRNLTSRQIQKDTRAHCIRELRALLAQPAAGTPTTNEGEK